MTRELLKKFRILTKDAFRYIQQLTKMQELIGEGIESFLCVACDYAIGIASKYTSAASSDKEEREGSNVHDIEFKPSFSRREFSIYLGCPTFRFTAIDAFTRFIVYSVKTLVVKSSNVAKVEAGRREQVDLLTRAFTVCCFFTVKITSSRKTRSGKVIARRLVANAERTKNVKKRKDSNSTGLPGANQQPAAKEFVRQFLEICFQ